MVVLVITDLADQFLAVFQTMIYLARVLGWLNTVSDGTLLKNFHGTCPCRK